MIVVTGATGNVGRPLIEALTEAGEQVVAVSRRPLPSPAEGVRHAQADLGNARSMRPVLEGADAFFILLAGELLGHGEAATELLTAAADAGVKRVVLLSSQINATRPGVASHGRLREFEEAVRGSGLDFTILRAGGFASNAFAWAESVRADRTVFAPFGDVALPVVDPADIAAAAAVVLREDGHAGRTYELTGPEAITPRRQAEVIAEATGDEVTFVELTREAAHAHMAQFMPEEVIPGTLDILGEPLSAEQRVSPDVERILSRPATPFSGWVARSLPAFK
ncbi:NAD(P)H-binding protein [Streptomyces sp. NPDC059466]|uniref:NmrA family NAD(P)-binding protein n=1 Tax=Streptomyces sp. NPDC059466 TaxID=3346843 RepID=UPI0036A819C4